MKNRSKIKSTLQLYFITFAFFSFVSMVSFAQEKFGGLALYTLRDEMALSPKDVLKEVANIGYKYIESAEYSDGKFYGMSPLEFKNYLNEIGLIPMSAHQGTVTFENADKMIEDVKAAGFKYFVIPVPPMGLFKYYSETQSMGMTGGATNLAKILNALGEKCYNAGLKLLYHNHDFEFKKNEDGIVTIDYLLENTNPNYVNFQMDLYWVTKAGAKPISYFEKYPGRFKSWHIKDMDERGNFAPVGNGNIDFYGILDKKDLSGMEFYLVEQDLTFNMKPMEAIKISHEGLKRFGFE
ncbi:sugar phosphate isomerase/epimerase family protein [Confluentibacter sediminis]|uniref:sugar phosphate isomerase/epimerase family protein n=1 Tax=Confluentibacter sediminis TaxID=2219045 RepID=UPI000DAB9FCF